MAQNLEQKVDAILAAVQNPPAATVDPTVLANAINTALATALAPIQTQLTGIVAGVQDIQSQVDEPTATATAALSTAATAAAANTAGTSGAAGSGAAS